VGKSDDDTYLSLNEQNCWLMTCQTISSDDMSKDVRMAKIGSEGALATGSEGGREDCAAKDRVGRRGLIKGSRSD
jgi:hypothetical protein